MERNCRQVLGGTSGGYRCPCPYLGLAKASGLLWMTPASVLTSPRHPRYSRTLSEPTIAPTHPVSPCLHPPPPPMSVSQTPALALFPLSLLPKSSLVPVLWRYLCTLKESGVQKEDELPRPALPRHCIRDAG